ncbi:MAG: hypothetical protein IJQ15_10460 [Synergistaceae bacterium]|nr:hypothetical protein [Synergistaceae bacterium]
MKKVYVLVSIQLLMFGTVSYGAVSDDVYVRKDVFEVYMQSILQRLDKIDDGLNNLNQTVANLSARVEGLDKRIDGLDKRMDGLDKRIDGLDKRIDGNYVALSSRIDDLRNGIYLWLVAIGLFVSWPKVKESAQKWVKPTPSITLEDVRRLIEENNAKIAGKPQA